MIDLGIVNPGKTLRIPFSSFDKDDGSSITMTNFAVGDILIYKDGSTTERASTAGYTATTDFDSKTGKHVAIIDLADNTTAGFFSAGSEYLVAIDAVTVDGVTTGGWIARFEIGYPAAILNTTIATLSSQTSFTLTAGPAENDALKDMWAVIHDVASAVQKAWVLISAYTGSTKTVTLAAGATFTAAAGDNISIMFPAPMQSATIGRKPVVDSAGLVDANAVKVGPSGSGVTQTAGDLAALITTVDDFIDTEVAAIKAKTDNLPSDPADASDIVAAFSTVNSTLSTIAGYLDTEIAAIKAKTDNLPSDPADASDIAASFSSIASTLSTIAGYLDTEVAAIKAKTDNLPSDPADASDIAASFSTVNSSLATIAAYIDTEVAAIKAKTDNLPSDPADQSALEAAITAAQSALTTLINAVDDLVDTEVAAIKAVTDSLGTKLPTSPFLAGSENEDGSIAVDVGDIDLDITVHPYSTSAPQRVIGTRITLFEDEAGFWVPMTSYNADRTALNLTGKLLQLIIEDNDGNVLDTLEEGSGVLEKVSAAAGTWRFKATADMCPAIAENKEANWWTLSDVTSGVSEVLAWGRAWVQRRAGH